MKNWVNALIYAIVTFFAIAAFSILVEITHGKILAFLFFAVWMLWAKFGIDREYIPRILWRKK